MLEFLRVSKDDYTTIDLVGKVAELAEKYPSVCVCGFDCRYFFYNPQVTPGQSFIIVRNLCRIHANIKIKQTHILKCTLKFHTLCQL